MSQQPSPKADQLRAMREAKYNKRGADEKSTSSRTIRKGSNDAGSGVPAVVRSHTPRAKKAAAATKAAKGKAAKRGKKQTAPRRKQAVL